MESTKEIVKKKFEDLEFVRVIQPLMIRHIPPELFEQIKDRPFEIERLYRFADRIIQNPTQLFYILIDKENQIKGIFWASANVICNNIDVNILSIDREYQFGDAIKKTLEFIDTFQKDATVRIVTSRTAKYEKAGFKKVKTVMEIQNKGL